ncbi:MAG: WD40 repeat domain-containing protein, partial [Pirellulaceae bacterium]
MELLRRYRLLIVIYGLAVVAACYESRYVTRPVGMLAGLGQPPPAADLLIDLYPDSPLAKCLKADRILFLEYDLLTAKRLLEEALVKDRFKGEKSYFYNYAVVLMLLKEDKASSRSDILSVDVGAKVLPKRLWFTLPGTVAKKRGWSTIDEAIANWRLNDLSANTFLRDQGIQFENLEIPAILERDVVRCAAMTQDGKTIVFAYQDNRLQFYDLTVGRPVRFPVRAHSTVISALAMAANDTQVVSASLDGDLAVWDRTTGTRIHQLLGHQGEVFDLAVFPDGIKCASVDRNSMVRIWDLQKGELLREFAAATRPLSAVAVSADGTLLATASWAGGIKLWSLQDTDAEPRLLEGHRGVVNRLVFTPDSTTLVSCSRDKTTRIWDVASGRERFVLEGHRAPVNGLAVSPDGTLVATASEDQSVKIWSLAEGKTL